MSLSIYKSSVEVFERSLTAFLSILDKAEAHAKALKFDPDVYLSLRIRPDMFAFVRQVQTLSDHAKNACFRLAGATPPVLADTETTFEALRQRVRTTLELVKSVDPAAIESGAEREVVLSVGGATIKLTGADYLLHFAQPNFYFHLTTAYDLLRGAGVSLGKRDFLGVPPGWPQA